VNYKENALNQRTGKARQRFAKRAYAHGKSTSPLRVSREKLLQCARCRPATSALLRTPPTANACSSVHDPAGTQRPRHDRILKSPHQRRMKKTPAIEPKHNRRGHPVPLARPNVLDIELQNKSRGALPGLLLNNHLPSCARDGQPDEIARHCRNSGRVTIAPVGPLEPKRRSSGKPSHLVCMGILPFMSCVV